MVQYAVDKLSSSNTSCLTDSPSGCGRPGFKSPAGKPSEVHQGAGRNVSFGYILLASLQRTLK